MRAWDGGVGVEGWGGLTKTIAILGAMVVGDRGIVRRLGRAGDAEKMVDWLGSYRWIVFGVEKCVRVRVRGALYTTVMAAAPALGLLHPCCFQWLIPSTLGLAVTGLA